MEIVTYREMGRNGRFGNQLFQVAGTIAYALDHGKDFVFPEWEYSKWMQKALPVGDAPNAINVPVQFHYAPIEDIPGKNVNLVNGHMQSSKYFAHHWDTIKPYLTLKSEYEDYIHDKYKRILYGPTCSIHVRRTDYDTPTNRDYHGVLPIEYYKEAMQYVRDRVPNVIFIICSDDIPWCKKAFSFPGQSGSGCWFIEGESNVIDMYIMASCENHIIANSSFSWWSAYLGWSSHKIVVCPKNWFNNAPVDSKDVACEGWIVI